MKSVELFAGAGGLGMGASLAGFKPEAIIEWDKWACETIRENVRREFPLVADWSLHEGDVRSFDYASLSDDIDLVTGGPPCQPFSMAGKHVGSNDRRDMFPASVEVVRQIRPRAFIFENVRGLTRPAFANYFHYIILQLGYPEITRRSREDWSEHFSRLEREKTSGRKRGLTYDVVYRVLNAADFGVPQKRERVFIVGFRNDQEIEWSFPSKTHSYENLLVEQWVTHDYWVHHGIANHDRPEISAKLISRLEKLKRENGYPNMELRPWRTARDALSDLPDPRLEKECRVYRNHRFQPGARRYPGHTGSPLDLPSKTLKAGDHGVPGGENMMVLPDGGVRYFTVREAARLQTIPDGYVFKGAWSEAMRQLGNAVPVTLAHVVSASVAEQLLICAGQQLIQ